MTNQQAISLKSIIANTPQYIFWKGTDFTYLGCNANFAFIAGLNCPDDIIGKSDLDLPWGKFSADIYLDEDQLIITTGKPLEHQEVPLVTAQDELITILVSKKPLFNDDGEVIGILGIYMDITQRKQYEAMLKKARDLAESADRAKSEFIANMSHDIRTPLTGVIGMAKMLEDSGDSSKDREHGQVIHSSSERLLILLNDILEVISTEEANKEDLQFEIFNLRSRIKYLRDLTLPNFYIKGLALNIFIDPKLPEYIISDRIKIDRVLLNIVSNALKFTSSGAIGINLKMLSQIDDHIEIEITISDTGIGIGESQLDKIFDRFYRIHPSYSNMYKGHGIGLYIVQKYVSLLQGKISVASELGHGTTFTINLPLRFATKEHANLDEKTGPASATPSDLSILRAPITGAKNDKLDDKGKSCPPNCPVVLLIEDDVIANRVAKNLLENSGFEVKDADNAEQGVHLAITKPFDLIITDIGLPGMDGDQFATLIRTWEKITYRPPIPIIGLTAHQSDKDNETPSSVIDKLIPKPLNNIKLKALIQQFFPDLL